MRERKKKQRRMTMNFGLRGFIYFLLTITLFTGCASHTDYFTNFNYSLSSVERPEDTKNRYGESSIIDISKGDTIQI